MKMKLRPLHDRVVVKRLSEDEKTAGGIIIPDSAKEKPTKGEIVAIGSGAMVVSHANDSYFWIIKEFTGLTVKEALRSFSLLTALMSITALLAILVIYWTAV